MRLIDADKLKDQIEFFASQMKLDPKMNKSAFMMLECTFESFIMCVDEQAIVDVNAIFNEKLEDLKDCFECEYAKCTFKGKGCADLNSK